MNASPVRSVAPPASGSGRPIFWALADQAGAQGSALIVFLVLARLIDPAEYGVFVIASALVGFPAVLLFMGFGEAVIQREEIDDAHMSTALWSDIALSLVLIGGLSVASLAAKWVFGSAEIGPVVRWLSLTCLLRALVNVPLALLRRELRMRIIATRTIVGTASGVVVGMGLALHGWGVWSLVGQQLMQGTLSAVFVWWQTAWRPRLVFSPRAFQELFSFVQHFMAAGLVRSLNEKVDNLMIGAFLDLASVGHYALALRLVQAATAFTTEPAAGLIIPVLSRLSGSPEALRAAYVRMATATTSIAVPALFGLGAIAPTFLPLFLNEGWDDSAMLLRNLCICGLAVGLTTLTGPTLSSVGRPDLYARIAWWQLLMSVVGFGVAVCFGIAAVSLTWAALSLLLVPLHLFWVRRICGVSLRSLLLSYLRVVGGGVVMICAIAAVAEFTVPGLRATLAQIAIGMATYFATMRVLMPGQLRLLLDLKPTRA